MEDLFTRMDGLFGKTVVPSKNGSEQHWNTTVALKREKAQELFDIFLQNYSLPENERAAQTKIIELESKQSEAQQRRLNPDSQSPEYITWTSSDQFALKTAVKRLHLIRALNEAKIRTS